MSTTITFSARSQSVVGRFLQTVVLIDDQARFSPTGVKEAAQESLLQSHLAEARKVSALEDSIGVDDPDVGELEPEPPLETQSTPSEVEQEELHDLNAQKLIERFAAQGLVCAILKPEADNLPTVIGDAEKAARRADVVIVDWQIIEKNGNNALNFITHILENDRKEGGRLRLIVIYTGEPDIQSVITQVAEKLKMTDTTNLQRHQSDPVLHSDTVRITAIVKKPEESPYAESDVNARYRVSISELPQRIIEEFAQMTGGLVTNTALSSLAVVRERTHALLTKMHKGLDAPFLTHKALLPQPEDASQFLISLVGEELCSMISTEDVLSETQIEAINAWILENHGPAPLKIEDKNGAVHDLNHDKLFQLGKENAFDSGEMGDLSKANAPVIHRNLTAAFSKAHDRQNASRFDEELAMLTTVVSVYGSNDRPLLTLGTVLRRTETPITTNNSGNTEEPKVTYWLCIQPACDCIRLKEDVAKFPLLPLVQVSAEQKTAFNMVVPGTQGQANIRLLLTKKIAACEIVSFLVCDGCVRATYEDDKQFFESAQGRFEFVAQLKFPNAQSAVQGFTSDLSRVGTDVSEWMRCFK